MIFSNGTSKILLKTESSTIKTGFFEIGSKSAFPLSKKTSNFVVLPLFEISPWKMKFPISFRRSIALITLAIPKQTSEHIRRTTPTGSSIS